MSSSPNCPNSHFKEDSKGSSPNARTCRIDPAAAIIGSRASASSDKSLLSLGYIPSTAASRFVVIAGASAIMTIKSLFTPAGSGQAGPKSRRERCAMSCGRQLREQSIIRKTAPRRHRERRPFGRAPPRLRDRILRLLQVIDGRSPRVDFDDARLHEADQSCDI